MTDLRLRESGLPIVCDVDAEAVAWLVRHNAASAAPAGSGRWELRPLQKVGVVRIGTTTVWIQPKLTVSRLLWLLGWARQKVFTLPQQVGLDPTSELVPVLAEAFCIHAERALQLGVLQGYVDLEASEPVLRGRLRADEQLRRRFGLAVPLLVRYDDYLIDIPENQLLKGAAARLLRLPGTPVDAMNRLRVLRGAALADVSELVPGRPLPESWPTRLNARYHDALWLASLILAGGSLEHEPGAVHVDGFLLDLSTVFEHFVAETLSVALERLGGHCQAQDRYTLDEDGTLDIRPDLVWRRGVRPLAVVDAKYKAERPVGFPQADLYQTLAYATAYNLDCAHLIYAEGNETARQWTVRHSGVRIVAHTLDLSAPPVALLGQVESLAERIAALAGV